MPETWIGMSVTGNSWSWSDDSLVDFTNWVSAPEPPAIATNCSKVSN